MADRSILRTDPIFRPAWNTGFSTPWKARRTASSTSASVPSSSALSHRVANPSFSLRRVVAVRRGIPAAWHAPEWRQAA